MKKRIADIAEKGSQKFKAMRQSDKKGMEVIGWILTIVFTLAIVAIVWMVVQPAVSSTTKDAGTKITGSTTNIFDAVKKAEEENKKNP